MPDADYPKRIPRERAVAALDLASKLLDFDDDLKAEAQPGGYYEGEGDPDEVAVPFDAWKEWAELSRRAVALGYKPPTPPKTKSEGEGRCVHCGRELEVEGDAGHCLSCTDGSPK